MSAEPDVIEGEHNDEPEHPHSDPPWAQGADDPMAAPLSKWAPTPIVARLEVVASTQIWSAQLLVRPDMMATIDLVRAYRDVILSLALDFPPSLTKLGREIFALLDRDDVERSMGPAPRAALRRALDAVADRLATPVGRFRPCRMEVHAYVLERGGASGTARDVGDDLGTDSDPDALQVTKAVIVLRLLREIALLLEGDWTAEDRVPVRPAW